MASSIETTVVNYFTELTSAVVAALPANKRPARVIPLIPGTQVVWDSCEEGQLTCRLSNLVPHSNTARQACGVDYWTATCEITLLRCAAVLDDQGRAPLPGDLVADGRESLADTDLLLKTISTMEWVTNIQNWRPWDPQGGCKGVEVLFEFRLDHPS
jgi:hypothetical protein